MCVYVKTKQNKSTTETNKSNKSTLNWKLNIHRLKTDSKYVWILLIRIMLKCMDMTRLNEYFGLF